MTPSLSARSLWVKPSASRLERMTLWVAHWVGKNQLLRVSGSTKQGFMVNTNCQPHFGVENRACLPPHPLPFYPIYRVIV